MDRIETLMLLNPDDITLTMLTTFFMHTIDSTGKAKPPLYEPNEVFKIDHKQYGQLKAPTGIDNASVRYCSNWSEIKETTVGRFIFNSLVFHRTSLRLALPYFNESVAEDKVRQIQQLIIDKMFEKELSHADYEFFLNRLTWLGYNCASLLNATLSYDSQTINPAVAKMRDTELKKMGIVSGQKLSPDQVLAIGKLETELIKKAKSEMANDPALDIFASKTRGTFENNYKNVAIMRGCIKKSDDPSIVHFSKAALSESIPANEQSIFADLAVQASYGRAMNTRDGGYKGKQLNAALSSLYLNPVQSYDCKTPFYEDFTLTADDVDTYLYSYIMEGGKPVELTRKNIKNYIGKTVKLRSPLYCRSKDGLCAFCMGTRYYRQGILRIGLLTSRIGTTLLNGALKAFHDSSMKLESFDLLDAKFITKIE